MGEKERTVVIGLGNILFRDEGFGVHFVRYMKEMGTLPPDVALVDGGTGGLSLRPWLEGASHVVLVDALALENEPGAIHRFMVEDLRHAGLPCALSPHQIGILEVLGLLEFIGTAPHRVVVIGVVPEDVGTGIGLSSRVSGCIPKVAAMVQAECASRYWVSA